MNENFNKARLISVVFIVAFLLPIFPATIGALKAASESSPEIFHEFSMFLFGGMIIFIHFPILNVIFAGINRFWLFLGSYVLLVAYGHIYQYMMLIVSGKHYESFSELFAGKSYSFFGTVGDFTIALIPYLKYYVALIIVIHIYLFKKRGGDFRDIEMISALCDIDYPWHRRYELIQSIARDYPNIRDRRYLLEILINYWKIGKPNRVFDITLYVSSRETRESLGLDTAQELSRVPSQDSRIEQESINNMMAEAERVRGEYSIHTSIRDRQRAQQAGNIYGECNGRHGWWNNGRIFGWWNAGRSSRSHESKWVKGTSG